MAGKTLDVEALRAKYAEERDKRLRTDGKTQFQELTGQFADFDRDPFADPNFTRDSVTEEVEVVIMGGGFGGMLAAVELTERGVTDFRIVEKAADFGGTWYWNRYPGCMCDVESYTYLPLLEETGFMPTMRYSSAQEIFEYCQRIGRRWNLYDRALFQTNITDAVWEEAADRWRITTSRGDALTTKFLITAGGILHKAKLPGIEGITDFQGRTFHAGRWDYGYTGGSCTEPMTNLKDKRVGIIGTGATSIQAVPRLAEAAQELFVFQRTPSPVGVRNNAPTDEAWFKSQKPGWHWERIVNFTAAVTGKKPEVNLVQDGWTEVMWENTAADGTPEEIAALELSDFETMQSMRDRVDAVVGDPEIAEKLKPWYGKSCKRVCFHDEYLQAFNRDNVHLVDTDGQGVERITANGVVANGVEYPVDLLIIASGYENAVSDYHRQIGFDAKGRGGVRLSEKWAAGPRTLHGVFAGDFPNWFMMSTIQGSFGTNYVHFLRESARHIAWLVQTCDERGINSIEASTEAEEEWLMTLYGRLGRFGDYSAVCTPSYYNNEQTEPDEAAARGVIFVGAVQDWAAVLEGWRADGSLAGTVTT